MHFDIIHHPFPINSQYLKVWVIESPDFVPSILFYYVPPCSEQQQQQHCYQFYMHAVHIMTLM